MLSIGLAGWGDHDELYGPGVPAGDRLRLYSRHFPVVEIDATFYAIPAHETCTKWAQQTPAHFQFVVKAYKGLTGHERNTVRTDQLLHMLTPSGKQEMEPNIDPLAEKMTLFLQSIEPLRMSGKLRAVLFQYPPWFDCTRDNVNILRKTKQMLGDLPVALEFRHSSWFSADYRAKTLKFMETEGWIHSVCDEPQVEPQSVPTVLHATDKALTIVRMHGRNVVGWSRKADPNWRENRYLYDYSRQELQQWKGWLDELQRQSEHVCILFNNNSGGDAARNAKLLMELLDMQPPPMAPKQLEWFDS